MNAKIVALDFDGVIHSYSSGWTGPEPIDLPEPGALEFVLRLQARGYRLVVFTTRANSAQGKAATERWLRTHGFPPMTVTDRKGAAIAYVDDRAVSYTPATGDGWAEALARVDQLARPVLERWE